MAEAYNKKGCDDEYDMKEECPRAPDPPHFPPFLFNPFPPFPFVPSPPARAHTSVFPPPFSSPPPIVCSHGAASPL
ncbi:unnamed protein product, partial [Closterium sp. NIES-64]